MGYEDTLHGAMLSAFIDQIASMCAVSTFGPTAATAEMTVWYRKMVPLPSVVLYCTVVTKRQDRKL